MPNQIDNLVDIGRNVYDLIVISTQESTRSIFMSFFWDSKTEWENKLKTLLGEHYLMKESVTMNALHICVFAHRTVKANLQSISTDCLRTGIFGLIGNKGEITVE